MDLQKERITRATEKYMYDWINKITRATAEKHLPKEIVEELRGTKTVGEWHRVVSRISSEIWAGATDEEIDAAIIQSTADVDEMIKLHAAELGRRGGRSKSPAKQAASRRNGRKGGRPRRDKI